MSTRAVYTFIDNYRTYHVYKHCDGYPKGAAEFIKKAIPFAWELPRFEAADFAAAFVAANKQKGGDVYLTRSYENHDDLDYRYEIRYVERYAKEKLHIAAYRKEYYPDKEIYKKIFEGTLDNFMEFEER